MRKDENKRKKKKLKSRKNGLKRALTVFYAVNAVVLGAFLLYIGITVAQRNTLRNIDGNYPELVYWEDVMMYGKAEGKKF